MRNKLISSLAGAVIAALIGTSAFAAAPKKKIIPPPPPPPAPVYTWTGWYVGGNVGYGWGRANTDIAGSLTTMSLAGNVPFTNGPFPFADSGTQRLNGVIGGGQVGYNYQFSPSGVVGLEADFQGSGERGSNTFTSPFSGELCFSPVLPNICRMPTTPINGAVVTSYEAKIEWFGTVRGRLGVLINDGLLLYGTGGLAYGHVGVSGNVNISASQPNGFTFGPTTSTFSQSKTNVGWTAGAGVEGRFVSWLPPNWTWKLEYLYVDLGSLDTSTPISASPSVPGVFTPLAGTMTTHTHFTDNIVRVGLNYQFH